MQSGNKFEKVNTEAKYTVPKRAVILAAGFGMRMVPINTEVPKGLIEVNGERLIERVIKQLREVGIYEIHIVVGFLKEKYGYLIEKYGVDLIENPDYATTNNLHSVLCAIEHIADAYIIPCDLWFRTNPFGRSERCSWYMVSREADALGDVVIGSGGELIRIQRDRPGNKMVGLSYLTSVDAARIAQTVRSMCSDSAHDDAFWEEALYADNKMIVRANICEAEDVAEINTFEQLRELDGDSKSLKANALNVIMDTLGVEMDEIKNITVLKKGMTNRSFLFECKDKKYIMRIPGEGTSELIDRAQEAAVYRALRGKNISDNVLYLNPENGYKITEFLQNARVCDPADWVDVCKCMAKLKEFHDMELSVEHEFALFEQIEKYERLRGDKSIYADYDSVKRKVESLRDYISRHIDRRTLAHIDAVPDNFMFVNIDGKAEIKLIDWEYAGMQDPHVDIAMFCIYAIYNDDQIDKVIDLYFENNCPFDTRLKIYCYVAACGLLWSNWCEYKRSLGVDFGEYALAQYEFAKAYSNKALRLLEENR